MSLRSFIYEDSGKAKQALEAAVNKLHERLP